MLIFLGFGLFIISLIGILSNYKNILILMIYVEILLAACTLEFITFSLLWVDPLGQIYALLVITLAACESALGLGLLISAYRLKRSLDWPSFSKLKG